MLNYHVVDLVLCFHELEFINVLGVRPECLIYFVTLCFLVLLLLFAIYVPLTCSPFPDANFLFLRYVLFTNVSFVCVCVCVCIRCV